MAAPTAILGALKPAVDATLAALAEREARFEEERAERLKALEEENRRLK